MTTLNYRLNSELDLLQSEKQRLEEEAKQLEARIIDDLEKYVKTLYNKTMLITAHNET